MKEEAVTWYAGKHCGSIFSFTTKGYYETPEIRFCSLRKMESREKRGVLNR
jgi:hypothetical protein